MHPPDALQFLKSTLQLSSRDLAKNLEFQFFQKTFCCYTTAIKALNPKLILEFTLTFQVYTSVFILTIPCELKV